MSEPTWKNRPNLNQIASGLSRSFRYKKLKEAENWFEAFEKKMRGFLDHTNPNKQHPIICAFIEKEILGDVKRKP